LFADGRSRSTLAETLRRTGPPPVGRPLTARITEGITAAACFARRRREGTEA